MGEITGKDIHREWRNGMLKQGRPISPQRMKWKSLSTQDKVLDDGIANALMEKVLIAPALYPLEALLDRAVEVMEASRNWLWNCHIRFEDVEATDCMKAVKDVIERAEGLLTDIKNRGKT